jgi:hypothetical protein
MLQFNEEKTPAIVVSRLERQISTGSLSKRDRLPCWCGVSFGRSTVPKSKGNRCAVRTYAGTDKMCNYWCLFAPNIGQTTLCSYTLLASLIGYCGDSAFGRNANYFDKRYW